MNKKKKHTHISFEVLHIYAGDEAFEARLRAGAAKAKRWVSAIDEIYPNATFANLAFVDDYSETGKEPINRSDIVQQITSEFEKAGVPLDYIAFESDCAATCHYLRTDLVKPPIEGAGSFLPPLNDFQFDDIQGRLSFDYVSQDFDPDTEDARSRGINIASPEFRNDVGIGVSIGRETNEDGEKRMVWSCPAAAAWWQLIRLGILQDVDEPNLDGAPIGTWQRDHDNRSPFVADKTLSLLDPSYISVEHAVRVILNNLVDLGPSVRKSTRYSNSSTGNEWLNRIGYLFDAN